MGYIITILERGELGSGISRGKVGEGRVTWFLEGRKDEADAGQKEKERQAEEEDRKGSFGDGSQWRGAEVESAQAKPRCCTFFRPWGREGSFPRAGGLKTLLNHDYVCFQQYLLSRMASFLSR